MAATIKHITKGAIVVMVLCLCSCTKYNYINGGTANGIHDCTMWEYFHTNSYDWDSTVVMIEHAGLKSLFDGTGEYKQITFFGLTSNSILRYMLENNYERVTDIPVGKCQDIIQKLVAPKRIMLNDVPRGNRIQSGGGIESAFVEYDGLVFDCIRGSLFLWTQRMAYNDIEDTGEIALYIASRNQDGTRNERVASTDIQTTNGVVHSLNYDFRFRNF
ncbi:MULTISPECIES: hypothetical protein [Butyricimonas]|jgi:hypothetical protein|uniref:FAS1 domain-containing protein n=1 Tax=Butyricimonas faecihominis TaxID=1472416 RepID=A0A7W6HYX2_9BACT|nr:MULTISPECIES: hypothetical protein [Butyricimonas]MBS6686989.1 hypothetical protein [Sanguibacteroides justesenii]KAB1505672.1 hypothetical protein F8R21_12795 [Butyricimonas faecihominis]MBB4027521.1 hypothetical protein [Butyricimonas faecihominis]WOF10243.1 hypothetical protein F1611_18580 [Butyricimonas faecihominis]BEI57398.1 hypothetical protein Bfae18676_23730 [Butyricimonas faecihominis]